MKTPKSKSQPSSHEPDDQPVDAPEQDNSMPSMTGPIPKTPAEWVTFCISGSIVGGLMLLVGVIWWRPGSQELPNPVIYAHDTQMIIQSEQFHIPFEVVNEGGETAIAVQVVGQLKINGQIERSGVQTIDFLSPEEREEGVFVFQSNPRLGELSIRVTNYQRP